MDLIDALLEDHQTVKTLFTRLAVATPSEKEQLFATLRENLVRHEVAEEEIVRPLTRSSLSDGESIAEHRVAEESQAEETLKKMEKTDIATSEWDSLFETLRTAVLAHAEKEESIEFPGLRANVEKELLDKALQAFEAAKKMAPTHPHPNTPNTATANLALGPLAALIDRARDAIAKAKSA
jgi:iron-sulfur cluster repair protein YtfE (RIC family)